MNTTVRITTRITTEKVETVDLASMQFIDWPVECRETALQILGRPVYRKQFLIELFKREWLAAKVAKMMSVTLEDLW